MTLPFSPNSAFPLYRQVIAWLEERIASGDLPPGARLPSTDGLAAELGVGRKVIQQALASLSARGMLDRSPGRGTFVSPAINSRQIAVLFRTNLLAGDVFSFNRLVCNEVLKGARCRGFHVVLHFPTDADDAARCTQEIAQLADKGKLRGLIAFGEVDLAACSVPCVIGSSLPTASSVRDSLAFRGLTYLISRGYHSIAILEHSLARHPYRPTVQAVEQILADHAVPPKIRFFQGRNGDPDRDGRQVMNDILDTPGPRPQALLSLDDNLTRGAIFSIIEHGLRIPDDIAVLSHANKGSAILSPVPLTLLENDPAEFANHALDALEARLDGRAVAAICSHPRLVIGTSCGE